MKKQNVSTFFKNKGFYISLATGIVAIAAIVFVYQGTANMGDSGKQLADLNTPNTNVAEENTGLDSANVGETNDLTNSDANSSSTITDEEQMQNDTLLENDVVSEAEENGTDDVIAQSTSTPENEAKAPVMSQENVLNSLSFDEETGLLWPVTGDVIMNFSMDKMIYFPTLGQYKCNPAIMIAATVGDDVKNASKGVVSKIEQNEETGLTVTINIGDDYSIVYGQLKDLSVKEGQLVKEGEVIGKIADPTKYYVIEGTNLYLKVTQNDEVVNPLLLLQ